MITLALDASTYRGTVAVLDDARVVVEGSAPMRGRDAEHLMPAVGQALSDAGRTLSAVERVICGAGPGSFTSLRIAASIAKGIVVGLDAPLYSVSSLGLIVAGNVIDGLQPRRYLAALDALRSESYVAEFALESGAVRQVGQQRLMRTEEIADCARTSDARPVGPDQPDHWMPHARGVALMLESILEAGPVDRAGWEPVYGRMAEAQVKWELTHGRSLPR